MELIDGRTRAWSSAQHDLVVLSVGMLPATTPARCYGVPVDKDGFIKAPESQHLADC
ncbi:MAG: NAD(P)/FAD-dependent oxidoreductase [Marinilabiliales bacterium]|nr:NAD(P)/FAD-dependent oxidoreductase [Marinilabiliales bacterium]